MNCLFIYSSFFLFCFCQKKKQNKTTKIGHRIRLRIWKFDMNRFPPPPPFPIGTKKRDPKLFPKNSQESLEFNLSFRSLCFNFVLFFFLFIFFILNKFELKKKKKKNTIFNFVIWFFDRSNYFAIFFFSFRIFFLF